MNKEAECKKCGGRGISIRWMPMPHDGQGRAGKLGWANEGLRNDWPSVEYMLHSCGICGYVWWTYPLDHIEGESDE